uniref:Putative secreted protein n=2 Tax=Ixodes ricinus TaxID=34613 RepID=V5ICC5_IXORI
MSIWPIRKMQLVLFAMVLILPAVQSGGFLTGSGIHDDCEDILIECGDKQCRLVGSGDFSDYDPQFCTLICTGPARPKLPNGVCTPGVGLNCTSGARETLRNWHQGLQSTLNGVLKKWCQSFPKN